MNEDMNVTCSQKCVHAQIKAIDSSCNQCISNMHVSDHRTECDLLTVSYFMLDDTLSAVEFLCGRGLHFKRGKRLKLFRRPRMNQQFWTGSIS